MFKKHTLQVSVVKTPNTSSATTAPAAATPAINIDKINTLVQENAKLAAVGFVGIYAAVTALKTVSEIAINAAPKR